MGGRDRRAGTRALLFVRVTPRAARDEVGAFGGDGVLPVRVTAPPTESAANEAVRRLLAQALGLPPRDVMLVSGASARRKTFEIPLAEAEVRRRLEGGG